MTEYGVVHNVRISTLGSYLAADAASSATVITVESAVDFNEYGGQLAIGGITYTYLSANLETDQITLQTGLSALAVEKTRVDVLPLTVEKHATVVLADSEESIVARVPHTLADRMPDGIREENARESVALSYQAGEFVVQDVLGKQPVIDGRYLDPATVPPASTDGLPPASSPTPTALGSIRQIYLTWTPIANPDPVTYDIHLSTTTGFTADGSNLVSSTVDPAFVVQVDNPDYTITYYLRIVARDDDGSAAAGAEVSVMLVPINLPDIAANAVRANNILVGELQAHHLSSNFFQSGNIQTAPSGRRVRMTLEGIQLIDTNESLLVDMPTLAGQPVTLAAELQTTAHTSLDNLEVRGQNNSLDVGSVVTLSAGVHVAAQAPTVTVSYPTGPSNLDNAFYRTRSVDWGSTYTYYLRHFLENTVIERRTISGQDGPSFNLYPNTSYGTAFGKGLAILNDTSASEDRAYVLIEGKDSRGLPNGVWSVRKLDVTNWTTAPVAVTDYTWDHDTGVGFFEPAIGRNFVNNTEYVTCEVLPKQTQFRFRRYSAATGSLVATATVTAPGTGGSQLAGLSDKHIRGCGYGAFGMSLGSLWMVAMFDRVWFWNTSSTFESTPSFFTNGTQNAFAWSGPDSQFKGYNNDDSLVTTYTDYDPLGGSGATCWAGYTLVDTVGTPHETTISSLRSFTMKKRAQIIVSAPGIPGAGGADDPDSVKFYLAKSVSAPANSALWSQTTDPAVGVTTITYTLPRHAFGVGAANPPTTNNFPTAAPALIQTPSGGTIISGDGSMTFAGSQVGVYASYTPVFGAAGGTPATSTAQGGYTRIGKWVTFWARVVISNGGTGNYNLSYPVTAARVYNPGISGHFLDLSLLDVYPITAINFTTGACRMTCASIANPPTNSGFLGQTFPVTAGVGDEIIIGGTYEAA